MHGDLPCNWDSSFHTEKKRSGTQRRIRRLLRAHIFHLKVKNEQLYANKIPLNNHKRTLIMWRLINIFTPASFILPFNGNKCQWLLLG